MISILSDNCIDLACISETWFSSESNTTTSIIRNLGYNIVHNFREKVGGGVCVIWNSKLNKQVRNGPVIKSFDTFQYQNIIFQGKFKINLMCLYRLQETSYSLFLEELNILLSTQDPCYPLVLTGDFNVHFQKSNLKIVQDLIDLTSSFGLKQFVSGPSNKFGNTIDLLFMNSFMFEMNEIQPISYNLGDHFPIFFNLPNIDVANSHEKKTVTYRDIKSVNIPNFAQKLTTSLNTAIPANVEQSNFTDLLNIYNSTVEHELDMCAPWKTRTFPASSSPPWMDADYRSNRIIRRKLERQWKKSRLNNDQTRLKNDKKLYVSQRNVCAQMSKDKRSSYYNNLIESKRGDQRSLYNIVYNLCDKSNSRGVLPVHDNAKDLANSFNQFYMTKVKQIRSKIPLSNDNNHHNFIIFNGNTLHSFRPISVPELREILKVSGIKTSFSDILPATLLKTVIEELLPYLCILVNKSLSTGSVVGMKESIVVPLLKKAGLDSEILKNYRPVADLVFLSKLTERVVAIQIFEHMSVNSLHCKYEHAYKKYHSSETLLVCLVNDILLSLDNNNALILLLIDLSAAFDTVDIDLLLRILELEIGIRGIALDWFESFLKDRNQRVLIENLLSDCLKVDFGVPQGSVLGPILFNIYIRSLFEIIESSGFSTSGYADDNNAHQSFAMHFQYDVICEQLPTLMSKIKQWMDSHFLKINPDKTEIITFLPNNLRNSQLIHGTFLEGDCIRFSQSVKNLGFRLDSFLTMDSHVNAVVSHCYKLISDVARIRHLLNDKDTESLMHSIVGSRLDYCNVLLYGVNKSVIQKFQKVQNAAARLISKRRKRDSVSDVLIDLHWLPVEQRIIFKLLVLTYKIVNGIAPQVLCSLISLRNEGELLLDNVYLNTNYGRRSFTYAAPRYWNALPINIRRANSVDAFKRATKHLLFNNFDTFKNAAFIYQ